MRDGAVAGFKYFQIDGANRIAIEINGHAKGVMSVAADPDFRVLLGKCPVETALDQAITKTEAALEAPQGNCALFFRFTGEGALNFHAFELKKV